MDRVVHTLVVSGTTGAGKTTVAEAVANHLSRRGAPVALLDLDCLGQVMPTPADDPFNQRLIFENLAAVWPNYARLGTRYVVLARVVEDRADRERYRNALGGAELTICLVTAPESIRRVRIERREWDVEWRRWHLARTVELAATLEDAALEDFSVGNTDDPRRTAASIVARLGWT